MNWRLIVTVVGFASAVIGLIRAFSFNHYESVVCHYEAPKKTNIFECIDRIIRNNENVILLNLEINQSRILPSGRSVETFSNMLLGKYMVYKFDMESWCHELGLSCPGTVEGYRTWHEKVSQTDLKYNFSANGTDFANIPFGHYGTWLYLMLDEHTLNPYSDAHVDAGIVIASGPFQVSKSNDDGLDEITLTPAPMTDSLSSEVRCARRAWPKYAKFFLCPFI